MEIRGFSTTRITQSITKIALPEIECVGGCHPIPVDVRVPAATNCDLQTAVAAGSFRQDLFYRLNVFPIQLPSLRERVDDIPLLVEYFIERYAKKAGKKLRRIATQTLPWNSFKPTTGLATFTSCRISLNGRSSCARAIRSPSMPRGCSPTYPAK